jgi:serine hydrolase
MPTTLIVPGLNDSPPSHWQGWLQEKLTDTIRVSQPDWDLPNLGVWAAHLAEAIDRCSKSPILVAHSFGVLAAVAAWRLSRKAIAGAMLVAPADPDVFGCAKLLPRMPLPFPSLVVASRTDKWMSFESAAIWADRWGAQLIDQGNVGHINVDSGHGPWPEGLQHFRRLEALTVRAATWVA